MRFFTPVARAGLFLRAQDSTVSLLNDYQLGITMRCLALFFFLFFSHNVLIASSLDETSQRFNIKQVNQVFDQMTLKLSTKNLSPHDLNAAIKTLSEYAQQAEQCMSDEKKRLTNIKTLTPQNVTSEDKKIAGADALYLSMEEKKITNRLSECRLLSIRTNEAIEVYKSTLAQMTQEETLTRNLPLWEVTQEIIQSPSQNIFKGLLQTPVPPSMQSPAFWSILGCSVLLISAFIFFRVRETYFTKHFLHIKKLHAGYALLLSLCLLAGAIFFYLFIFLPDAESPALLLALSQHIFFYLLTVVFIVLFSKLKRVRALFYSGSIDINSCRAGLLACVSFYTLASLGHILAPALTLNPLSMQFIRTLFLLIMLTTGAYFVYYLCYSHRHLNIIKHHRQLIQRFGLSALIICAMLAISGYYTLAIRITSSGLSTVFIVFTTGLIIHIFNKIYFSISHQGLMQTRIIKYFGYKPDQTFTELLILRTTLQLIVVAGGLFLILRSWGFATYYFESAYSQLLYGIHLGGSTIYPTRIVLGVIVYCLLYLLFRNISTTISRHQQFENEEETQVAIASILTYLGFALALICAFLVAGFNFTGLAIVAGALSVGVGLGLQSIVNNFVSGLILLIEKPIKPGDRINIDGIDGFVKKIRVRSTHIITPAHEDIIVPNSDLITRRVTNYVYSSKQLFIHCDINVPLGSDTKRVRDLMLQAANNHEDIIKTGRNKPYVLFSSFGEKSLVFQLCCLIKDVNKKQLVQSDLNFAIDELLHENNI